MAAPQKPINHLLGVHGSTILFANGAEILVQLVWVAVVALHWSAVDADPPRRWMLVLEAVAGALHASAVGIDTWGDARFSQVDGAEASHLLGVFHAHLFNGSSTLLGWLRVR